MKEVILWDSVHAVVKAFLSLMFLYRWLDNDNTIQQSNQMIVMMTIFMIRAKRVCAYNEMN